MIATTSISKLDAYCRLHNTVITKIGAFTFFNYLVEEHWQITKIDEYAVRNTINNGGVKNEKP